MVGGLLGRIASLFGVHVGLAVLAGGALSALNVEGLARFVGLVTETEPGRASWLTVIGLGFRYLLLGLALFVILSVWRANILAVSLGLSAPVAAVCLEWGLFSMREFGSDSDTNH